MSSGRGTAAVGEGSLVFGRSVDWCRGPPLGSLCSPILPTAARENAQIWRRYCHMRPLPRMWESWFARAEQIGGGGDHPSAPIVGTWYLVQGPPLILIHMNV